MNREDLILQHRGYAKALALQLAKSMGVQSAEIRDEMIQAAELGLVEAAEAFDPNNGAAFTTFCYYRVRGAAIDFLRKLGDLAPAVRRKLHEMRTFNEVNASVAGHSESGERLPTHERRAFDASVFSVAVGRLGAAFLLAQAQSGGEPTTSASDAPTAQVEREETRAQLQQALESLTPEQRVVIQLYYNEGLSMSEIGAKINCDKATVSRRHEAAVEALRCRIMHVRQGSGGRPASPRTPAAAPGRR